MQIKTIISSVTLFSAGTFFANAAAPITVNGIDYADSVTVAESGGGSLYNYTNGKGSIAVMIEKSNAWSGATTTNTSALVWVKEGGGLRMNNSHTINALKLDSTVIITATPTGAGAGALDFNSAGATSFSLSGNGFLDVNCDTIGRINISALTAGSTIYLNEKGKLTLAAGQWGANDKNISLKLLAADGATTGGDNYTVAENGGTGVFLITRKIASGSLDATAALTFDFNGLQMSESEKTLTTSDAILENLGSYFITRTDGELLISYIASSSMIPEPSAFGLLAGLGALALVASRRRRSRKTI